MTLRFLYRSLLFASALISAHAAVVVVDASKAAAPAEPLPFATGGRSPDGHTLAVNNRYMLLDGKPWFPVMGEFQYSRYRPENWEQEILKMKAGGVRIISTYVFWIHHEEVEGQFDWSGRRDLRRFVELARKHGMYVWARVGPWSHGEVRNGGLPDWVLAKSKTRQNDPAYLKFVGRFFGEIAQQLKGEFWKDGGPIVGMQIENEYHERGDGKGEAHIAMLRAMAHGAGMDAPFYSITGWDDAAIPSKDVVLVFGGYPDGFWYRPLQPLPPSPLYFFSSIRADELVGDDLCSKRPEIDETLARYPFFTAEMAGGMELSYHRRPVMSADDIAAANVTKLGSGVTMYGYYMFHGGTNPDGKLTTLQEEQKDGWQDLPQKAYDFQAPLGEYGQMHPSFRDLKSIHLFLHDFGEQLAPMAAYFPSQMPASKLDTETPRVAVRSDSRSGFIFVNNYQRDHPLPVRRGLQVEVKLAGRTMRVPQQPVDVPSGTYAYWPVNLPVGPAVLSYATAQPLTRVDSPDTYLFFSSPGVAPEFVFEDRAGVTIEAPQARVRLEGKQVTVDRIPTGSSAAISIRGKDGATARIVVLSREEARNVWKATVAGKERLIYTAADAYFEGDQVHLSSTDPKLLSFGIYPGIDGKPVGFRKVASQGIWENYAATAEPIALRPEIRKIKDAREAATVKIGIRGVAASPEEPAFDGAARWSIRVPELKPATGQVYLRLSYQGDVARLYAGGKLITDDFYHGGPWEIGLRDIPETDLKAGLELQILPLRADAPIYLAPEAKLTLPPGAQVAKLIEGVLAPEYVVVAKLRR